MTVTTEELGSARVVRWDNQRHRNAWGRATITGIVRSEAGQPLAAVTVFLTGLGLGTQTREDGHYTIVVPAARSVARSSSSRRSRSSGLST